MTHKITAFSLFRYDGVDKIRIASEESGEFVYTLEQWFEIAHTHHHEQKIEKTPPTPSITDYLYAMSLMHGVYRILGGNAKTYRMEVFIQVLTYKIDNLKASGFSKRIAEFLGNSTLEVTKALERVIEYTKTTQGDSDLLKWSVRGFMVMLREDVTETLTELY